AVAEVERETLEQALERSKHTQTVAARLLGLSYHPLRRLLKKHGLKAARDADGEAPIRPRDAESDARAARPDRRRAENRGSGCPCPDRRRRGRRPADAALQGRRCAGIPRSLRTPPGTAVPLFPTPGAPRCGRRPVPGDVAQGHSRRGRLFRRRAFLGVPLSDRAQRARRPLPARGTRRARHGRRRFAGLARSERAARCRIRPGIAQGAPVGGDRRAAAAATRGVPAARGDGPDARRDRRGRRRDSRDGQEPAEIRRPEAAASARRRGRAAGETRMNGENGRPGAPDDRFPPYRQARFDEVPPPHVDRAILQEAERAAGRRRWPRPAHLAWAAAVVLSVALVLEIGGRPPARPERAGMLRKPPTARDDAARRVTPARASREAAEQDGSARRETLDRAAPDQAAPALERFAAPVPGAARGS